MDTNLHLLITTIGYFISMLIVLGFGFFVFLQKERKPLHNVWFIFSISLVLYQIAFMLGVNTPATSKYAYWIWYSNLAEDILIGLFTLHVLILASDGLEKFKTLLKVMYGLAILIIGATILFPSAFLVNVIPKLYFKSYTNATGPVYLVIVGYFLLSILLSYYVLFYERTLHGAEGKKRIDYFIIGITFCFLTGVTAFAPDFNIPIDPGFSGVMGIFVLPLVYGIVKKGLMEIRLAIKQTAIVIILISSVTIFLIIVSFLSNWLIVVIPGFKFWMMPLLTSLVLFIIGFTYYKRERDQAKIKYEFITVIAHKFRTPLTRIRWQTDELIKHSNLSGEARQEVMQIYESTIELIRLSNLLITSSQRESYSYNYKEINLPKLVEKVLIPFWSYVSSKKISLYINSSHELPPIYADEERLDSAIHVLVENAINYTKENGMINIKLSLEKDTVKFSITDNGIGISEKDQPFVFNRFYRGSSARHTDTEGVGLGLATAKSIIEHQGGSIGFESEGAGKGSTFWFTFLAHKNKS